MHILIIGGAGFVGCNLAIYLKSKGYEIIVVDNLYRRGSELNLKDLQQNGIEFHYGDIRNANDLEKLPTPNMIILTAAQSSAVTGFDRPLYDLQTNFIGAVNVLQFAQKFGAGLIFFSSNKVYDANGINNLAYTESETRFKWSSTNKDTGSGFDINKGISEVFHTDGTKHGVYGLSKLCSDLVCREWHQCFGVKIVVNRFSCVAGCRQFGNEAQGWLAWWVIAAILNLRLTYYGWGGKQVRDVLFIKDVCSLIEKQIANFDTIAGHTFNVGGGMRNSLSLLEATHLLEIKLKNSLETRYVSEPRLGDHRIYISDISKVEGLFNWTPKIVIDEGIDQIIEWVHSRRQEVEVLYSRYSH